MKKGICIIVFLCVFCVFATGCANTEGKNENEIDVDLTALSGTMAYATVVDILVNPEMYMGQVIKARGAYMPYFFDETGLYYHYMVIEGVPGCCPQSLEFKWGDRQFPEDYPAEGKSIVVTGILSSYQELGQTWYYLAVDDLTVVE